MTEKMFAMRGLQVALLSRPATVRLNLVARVDTIMEESVKQIHPKLCKWTRLVQKPYKIKLRQSLMAQPFSLKVPRGVLLLLICKK